MGSNTNKTRGNNPWSSPKNRNGTSPHQPEWTSAKYKKSLAPQWEKIYQPCKEAGTYNPITQREEKNRSIETNPQMTQITEVVDKEILKCMTVFHMFKILEEGLNMLNKDMGDIKKRPGCIYLFYCRVIALQCHVSFCCTTKWSSCKCTCSFSPGPLPHHTPSHLTRSTRSSE